MALIAVCRSWRSASRATRRRGDVSWVSRDRYDNALAESFKGLYKGKMIRHGGLWRGLDHVECATMECVDWFNHRRLHGELGMIPTAEIEAIYYHQPAPALLAASQYTESLLRGVSTKSGAVQVARP